MTLFGKHQHNSFIMLISIVFLTALFSLSIGAYPLSLEKLIAILCHPFSAENPHFSAIEHHIIWHIRLPRIFSAFTAGAALALSGATLQGVFHNELVDPHIIGVTSGAAFGGSLAILLGFSVYLLVISAFTFGLLAMLLVYLTAVFIGRQQRIILILAGVVLSGFFSALTGLLQYLADSEEILPSIVFWLLGSFATATWLKFGILSCCTAISGYLLFRLRWQINLLSLGETQAKMFGFSINRIRWLVLLLCALLIAAQVAVSGSIGWIGLIIPHLARFLVGTDHRNLLPASFLCGGIFMIAIDTFSRTLTETEIPIGIITALFGTPIFTLLLLKIYRIGRHDRI